MRLLISDANILIDMEAGALMETLFRLPMQFGIPDLLYYEEIEPGSPGLERLGLQIMEVGGDFVKYAENLPLQYNDTLPARHGAKPSHNDYLALALAKQESCTLLTGDTKLRTVASKEQVTVMGTIGLLCAMVENQLLTVDDAFAALASMKKGKRWLTGLRTTADAPGRHRRGRAPHRQAGAWDAAWRPWNAGPVGISCGPATGQAAWPSRTG